MTILWCQVSEVPGVETGHGECNDKELDTWTVVLTIGEFKRRDIHLEINR